MKRHLANALSALLLVGLLATGAVAAADTTACVSRAEYDNMARFLSTGQVAGRFGTNGIYLGAGPERFRRGYDACWTNERRVVVWYSLTSGLSDDWAIQDY